MAENQLGPIFEVENDSQLLGLSLYIVNGATGLGIFKEYGKRAQELDSFVRFCSTVEKISLVRYPMPSSFASSSGAYFEKRLNEEYGAVRDKRDSLSKQVILPDVVDSVISHLDLMYTMLTGLFEQSQTQLKHHLLAARRLQD